MPFKFVSLTMLQNEADIIEYFVRANLLFIDHMVIVINPSSDNSEEILNSLSSEGLPITVWRTQINHYSQGEMLSWFSINLRERLNPDFLFLLDADEILLSSSKESFENAISAIPDGQVGSISWRTFLPKESTNSSAFDVSNYRSRLSAEVMPVRKLVVPSKTALHESLPFQHGTHVAHGPDDKLIPMHSICDVEIAHLPVRSFEQVREKAAAATLSRVIAHGTDWHGSQSVQYGLVWKMLKQTPVPDLRVIAMQYLNMNPHTDVPDPVKDDRLPNLQTRHRTTQSASDEGSVYLQLVERLFNSAFPHPDPTDILKTAINQITDVSDDVNDELPVGAFSSKQHARNLKCDWPPIEQALSKFTPRRILDLGCGLGAYLRLSETKDVNVFGIDGSPWSKLHFVEKENYLQHDLSEGPPSFDEKFDLSLCLEVVEHLPERAGLGIVEWLSRNSQKGIIFSAARPEQPGHCHITCREPEFWLKAFSDFGWSVDPASTASLRLTSTLHWFRCNLFVLRPERQKDEQGLSHLQTLSHPSKEWPYHGEGQNLIGYAGQHRSFTLDGKKIIPPLPGYINQQSRLKDLKLSVSELTEENFALREQVSNAIKAHRELAKTTNELLSSKWWQMARAPRRWSNSLRRLWGKPKRAWPSRIENLIDPAASRERTNETTHSPLDVLDALYDEFSEYTMTGKDRFVANLSLIKSLCPDMTEKSVVETGVWRGGMSFAMMKMLPDCKEFHLFDSFEGLPTPSIRDGAKAKEISELELFRAGRNYASYGEVLKSVEALGSLDRAIVHKGWFDETVQPSLIDRSIGVLRLDGDWYDSTMVVLERLFDLVVPGGLIIVDDYFDWPGCSQAVHDFLSTRKRTETIKTHNDIVAYIQKNTDTVLVDPLSDAELAHRRALNNQTSFAPRPTPND